MSTSKTNLIRFSLLGLTALLVLFILLVPDISLAAGGKLSTLLQTNQGLRSGWTMVLGFVDIVAVLGLIFIAFANILHINVEAFDIKRLLPSLIVGVILAHFSYFVCHEILVFEEAINAAILNHIGGGIEIIKAALISLGVGTAGSLIGLFLGSLFASFTFGVSSCVGLLLGSISSIILILSLLALAIMLSLRQYIVWGLIIASPLAFVLYFLPFGRGISEKWFSWFLKWVFMGPLVYFILGIMAAVTRDWQSMTEFTTYVALVVFPALAVYVPFALSGGVFPALWGKVAPFLALGAAVGGYKLGAKALDKAGNSKGDFGKGFWKAAGLAAYNIGDLVGGGGAAIREDVMKAAQSQYKKKQLSSLTVASGGKATILQQAGQRLGQEMVSDEGNKMRGVLPKSIKGLLGTYQSGNPNVWLGSARELAERYHDPERRGRPGFDEEQETIGEFFKELGRINKGDENFYNPEEMEGLKNINDEKQIPWVKVSSNEINRITGGPVTPSSGPTPAASGRGTRGGGGGGAGGPGGGGSGMGGPVGDFGAAVNQFSDAVTNMGTGEAETHYQAVQGLDSGAASRYIDEKIAGLGQGVIRTPDQERGHADAALSVLAARSAGDKMGADSSRKTITVIGGGMRETGQKIDDMNSAMRSQKWSTNEAVNSPKGKQFASDLNQIAQTVGKAVGRSMPPVDSAKATKVIEKIMAPGSPGGRIDSETKRQIFDDLVSG